MYEHIKYKMHSHTGKSMESRSDNAISNRHCRDPQAGRTLMLQNAMMQIHIKK